MSDNKVSELIKVVIIVILGIIFIGIIADSGVEAIRENDDTNVDNSTLFLCNSTNVTIDCGTGNRFISLDSVFNTTDDTQILPTSNYTVNINITDATLCLNQLEFNETIWNTTFTCFELDPNLSPINIALILLFGIIFAIIVLFIVLSNTKFGDK